MHAVSGFLLERQGNIEEAAQYNDPDTGLFFMRVRFACDAVSQDDLRSQLLGLAKTLNMQWTLHDASQPMRTVLMVSKEGHCLNDLLFRWKSGLGASQVVQVQHVQVNGQAVIGNVGR